MSSNGESEEEKTLRKILGAEAEKVEPGGAGLGNIHRRLGKVKKGPFVKKRAERTVNKEKKGPKKPKKGK
jgi:hypothetical protein